jgi:hypothetical protein
VKGVIFNLLAGAVCDEYGEDAWDELLDRAGLEGAWTSVGSYPHKDLLRVVAEAATMWQWTHDDVIRWFGRSALPRLASASTKSTTSRCSRSTPTPTCRCSPSIPRARNAC